MSLVGYIIIFGLILISVLIFVHEFGHFIMGKVLGVKVLTFSLGFPPKLAAKRIGETEYVIGAVPFGGYVKFLGEDATDEVPREEMARAFHMQPVWKRLFIVTAGPLMNILLPFLIYLVVITLQPEIIPAVVGMLVPGGPAERASLLPGDRIVEIDGKTIHAFEDLRDVIGRRAGRKVKVLFIREGKRMETTVEVERAIEDRAPPLGLKREVGRIGIYSGYRAPIIQVQDVESTAYRSGLRTGDLMLSLDGKKITRSSDLERIDLNAFEVFEVKILRPRGVKTPAGSMDNYEPLSVSMDLRGADRRGGIGSLGIESTELYVSTVTPGSVAERIGLRSGDRVVSLNGQEVKLWDQIEMTLMGYPESFHEIATRRPDGSLLTARFRLSKESTIDPDMHRPRVSYFFGAFNYIVTREEQLVPNPNPVARGLAGAFKQTAAAATLTVLAIVRIIQGEISYKTLGGPIMIFHIAGRAARKGVGSFLWIMALISVNLAIINVLPLPMFDGGMVVLLIFEAALRKAPGYRFKVAYQYVGIAVIAFLILFIFKLDIERYWDKIIKFFGFEA